MSDQPGNYIEVVVAGMDELPASSVTVLTILFRKKPPAISSATYYISNGASGLIIYPPNDPPEVSIHYLISLLSAYEKEDILALSVDQLFIVGDYLLGRTNINMGAVWKRQWLVDQHV